MLKATFYAEGDKALEQAGWARCGVSDPGDRKPTWTWP